MSPGVFSHAERPSGNDWISVAMRHAHDAGASEAGSRASSAVFDFFRDRAVMVEPGAPYKLTAIDVVELAAAVAAAARGGA